MTFNIPESLANKYRGSGYAIAAAMNGEIVDFRYLRDVLPDFEGDYAEDGSDALAVAAIKDPRLGPAVRHMQALGDVFFGMCSCWEFVEL